MSDTKSFEAKVTKIGDEIASLTLKEAVDLAEYMKDKTASKLLLVEA
jgi:hypothetical protein